MASDRKQIFYNDLFFRIIVSLLAAHVIVTFGAKQTIFELLVLWKYYRSVFLSFIIAFLLITQVYLATIKLDKHFDWLEQTASRIGLQVLFGLIVPSVSAFLLATLYYGIYKINIFNTGYLKFVFPVVVIMILLINVYYLAFYFYKKWQITENRVLDQSGRNNEDNLKGREVFLVQKGVKSIPLPVNTICYFYHNGEFNFVRTFNKEDFVLSQALDEVERQLDDKQFFRANRQVIVNFDACQHFEPLEYGKLMLHVTPPAKESIIISQKRAKFFKDWIGR